MSEWVSKPFFEDWSKKASGLIGGILNRWIKGRANEESTFIGPQSNGIECSLQWATFEIGSVDRKILWNRRQNERYDDSTVQTIRNRGYGMVTEVYLGHTKHPLYASMAYSEEQTTLSTYYWLLTQIVSLFFNNNAIYLLMQDNAQPHRARITTEYLENNSVPFRLWPAVAPTWIL